MSDLYLRQFRLTITPESGTGKSWTGLRCKFDITKTSDDIPNNGKITIYNLNDDSRSLLKDVEKKPKCKFEVGYSGKEENFNIDSILKTILLGDVIKVTDSYKRPDRNTTIEIGDGQKALAESKSNEGYKKGTPIKTIVIDQLKKLGVDLGEYVQQQVTDIMKSDSTAGYYSATGMTKDVLRVILKKYGKSFSIQNNEVILDPEIHSQEAQVLSYGTGLLEEPVKNSDGSISFKALINTDVYPGATIEFQTEKTTGQYAVDNVSFTGDTRGNEWYMMGETVADEQQ